VIGVQRPRHPQARDLARATGVDIRYYSIIYEVPTTSRNWSAARSRRRLRENFLGYAEIRKVFDITKTGKVAGCMITEGLVKRGAWRAPAARQRGDPRRLL
jgi:translation initiation factor IF-2